MTVTANYVYRKIMDIQNDLIELRAMLADLEIGDSEIAPELPRTGWRMVRGSHGQNYVRDPNGVDRLPAGYAR